MLALFLVCPGGEVSWWGFWFFMDKSSGAGVHAGCYAAPLSLVGVLVLLGGSALGGGCDLWFWRSYLFSYALYGACFFSLSAAALRLGGAAYVLLFSPSGAAALPAVVVGAGLVCVGDAGVVCSSRYAGDSFLAVSDGATRLFGVSHTLVILTVFCALALTFSVSRAAGSDTWRFVCDRTTHVLPALGWSLALGGTWSLYNDFSALFWSWDFVELFFLDVICGVVLCAHLCYGLSPLATTAVAVPLLLIRLFRLSAFESVHHLAAAERLISTSDLAAVCHPTVARWHGACCLLYCLVIFAATRRRLHVVIFYRRRPLAALSLFAVSALYYSVLLVVTPMLGGLAALFTTLLSVPTTMTIYALSGFPWYGHLVWWALLLALLAGPRRAAAGHLATAAFCALLFLAMLRCCDSPQPASQIASGWLAHHQPPKSISHLTPLRQRGPAAPDTLSSGFQWTPAAVPAAGVILWSSWCLVLWLTTSTPRTPRR